MGGGDAGFDRLVRTVGKDAENGGAAVMAMESGGTANHGSHRCDQESWLACAEEGPS